MAYSLSDVLNTIKKSMPKDLKNANPEELMGALGSLKDLANSVSQDMNPKKQRKNTPTALSR